MDRYFRDSTSCLFDILMVNSRDRKSLHFVIVVSVVCSNCHASYGKITLCIYFVLQNIWGCVLCIAKESRILILDNCMLTNDKMARAATLELYSTE